ncbi:MAG TPA: 1-deoxy-D-xylulose-5-phosphate synthase [Acidimicrobiales bacterium]|nr:1-deoxy-D-xylulose-5-phosphate synthase [Acidimicrobiales bacterium]
MNARPLMPNLLSHIDSPADLRTLSEEELTALCAEIREFIVSAVTTTGGHLGSNLGVVELTLALHRTFDSPRDVLLWDTGHQAYVHKLVTGRRDFSQLRQGGGLSGYPNRTESEHDWVENSHASTILSYAHGLASAFEIQGIDRRVVAVVGDGALTGGMAYEALNNLGHSGKKVLIVLNDNGRSYAPTVSRLSVGLTHLRLNPTYVQARQRIRNVLRGIPAVGGLAYSGVHGLTSAVREVVTPHTFFEALGIRYAGPIDGHDIAEVEQALVNASEWEGPIVIHVLTQKGRGYAPAEEDDIQNLHDFKVKSVTKTDDPHGDVPAAELDEVPAIPPLTFTDAFTRSLLRNAEADARIVAITAAMPGPTGLLPFEARFPDRFFDVGIAEQHAVTAAAGMAMAGLRPVVAIYSTFFSRAFDQANFDVGLHHAPVVFALDRAGITGDDGPSHHGLLDMTLALSIPGMTVFAPSSAPEVEVMLDEALALEGPSAIRFPKTPAPVVAGGTVGSGLQARRLRQGDGSACILAVGKMVAAAEEAADKLRTEGIDITVWDVRVVSPPDPAMLEDAARHRQVFTAEDGMRHGGAGMYLADALTKLCRDPGIPGDDGVDLEVPPVTVLGIPSAYIPQDKPDRILARFGLDGPGLAQSIRQVVSSPALPGSDVAD